MVTQIYVREQGATVRRSGERLVVSKDGRVLDEFPLQSVDQVVLMGNVQLTTPAAVRLLEREVDVVFLSSYGKFRGRLAGPGTKHARLRQAQLRLFGDDGVRLRVARAIVDGKIHNQRVVLLRQARRPSARPRGEERLVINERLFTRALEGMMAMRQAALAAADLEGLRGYEGKAAAYYFEAIRSLLDPAWKFDRRAYHPPPDPFNALLSFLYSLLLKDVMAAVNVVGFDPYLGCFHEIEDGRPSLPLDLMEEWRPLVADATALALVNRGSLSPGSFTWTGAIRRPVELGEAGSRLVLEAYGARLETKLYHPLAGPGGETSARQAIVLQARRLARFVMGELEGYEAVKAR
jgi:CRISPR-associated protein Cas1